MKKKTQNILIGTVIIAVLGYLIFFTGSDTDEKNDFLQDYTSTTTERTKSVIDNFVQKYNAQTIPDDIDYTFQLQNKMVSSSTPLVFTASLDDIYRSGDSYFYKFSPYTLDFNNPHNIYYTLDGCSDKVDQVSNQSTILGKYAVVARIEKIKTPTLTIESESDGPEEAYLEIDSSQARLASGTCLDLKYIEGSSIFSTSSQEAMIDN